MIVIKLLISVVFMLNKEIDSEYIETSKALNLFCAIYYLTISNSNSYIASLTHEEVFVELFFRIDDSKTVSNYKATHCFRLSNGSCEKLYQNLRRTQRHAGNNDSCTIPSYPNAQYKIEGPNGGFYRSGDQVSSYCIMRVSCDYGYKLKPLANSIAVCLSGEWSSRDLSCFRACRSLNSTVSTRVKCSYNEHLLNNCYDPVEGTIVLLSCDELYKESKVHTSLVDSVHLCLDGEWTPPLIQCKPTCGVKRPIGRENIIRGNETAEGNYPWQIAVYRGDSRDFICGGSLIDRRIVLSAAHCFSDSDGNAYPASNYEVSAGKYYRLYGDPNDIHAQNSKILSINIPEQYKGRTSFQSFDIAVLVLQEPFTITKQVQPVCIDLTEEASNLHISFSNEGIVTGWGYTQEGRNPSNVLKEAKIPIVAYSDCFDKVPINFRSFITFDKICGGYINEGISVCEGDSGGGLVVKNLVSNKYFIRGIVSTSPATQEQHCDSNQYSLYTLIPMHIKYVQRIVLRNQWKETIECTLDGCLPLPIINNFTDYSHDFLFELEHSVPASINITNIQTSYTTGSNLSINCNVQGYPNPIVTWLKDKMQIFPSTSTHILENHTLFIENVQAEDSGEYTCEAANKYSKSEGTVNVIVEASNSVEKIFIPSSCTDNPYFANCELIVKARYCTNKYYGSFCCKSCRIAGQ